MPQTCFGRTGRTDEAAMGASKTSLSHSHFEMKYVCMNEVIVGSTFDRREWCMNGRAVSE